MQIVTAIMKMVGKSNRILDKQFLLTLMISEFIIIVDYAFFYLNNHNAIGSFDTFIKGLLAIFFSIICLLTFVKLIFNKIYLFIPIGFFLITLYNPLRELFGYIDTSFTVIGLLALGMIFLTWILLYFVFRHEDSQKIIKNSFFVSLIFFGTSLTNSIFHSESKVSDKKSFELLKRNESPVEINFDSELELPNIIYIVPDRYGGIDQLKDYFGYDNSNFINALEDRGFIIGKDSRSNYPRTYASLLSTLNSSYIEASDTKNTRRLAYPAITNSYAYTNLHKLGYELYNLNNWWEGTRSISNEEFNFYHEYINAYQSPLYYYIDQKTPFNSIRRQLEYVLTKKKTNSWLPHVNCEIPKNQFKKLSDLTKNENNGLFVFAHFLVPHPPYLLNASGDCIANIRSMQEVKQDPEANKPQYLEYLQFFNDQILKIFDAMLKTNKNFIFIIQSDEGPYPEYYVDPSNAYWDLKTGNINAFYSSNKLELTANDLQTPINNFIYVYKYLFNSDTQLLEHVVHKYKTKEEDGAFDFLEINNF